MRKFWMVIRYRDEALATHPDIGERNFFYLQDTQGRREINHVLAPSEEQANNYAISLSQRYPTETIIVLEQKSIFELPELPRPIKKKFNSSGELIPDA